MDTPISRRTFVKAGITATATAYMGTHLSGGIVSADAAHTHPTVMEPTFAALPSGSPLGTDLMDLSQGSVGTLW
ncbi:MAG: hypothetical protein WBG76_09875, partial [Ornithinimicrobium sp.]